MQWLSPPVVSAPTYATALAFTFHSDAIEIPAPLRSVPVGRLPVSTRLAGVFQRSGIRVLGDLHGKSLAELGQQRNCGEKTLRELAAAVRLAQNGGEAVLSQVAATDAASCSFEVPATVRDLAFADLPISTRLQHLIERLNIRRLGDLHGRTGLEFLRCSNVGVRTVVEMQQLVARADDGEFCPTEVAESAVPRSLLLLIETGLEKLPGRDRDILLDRVGARGLKPITLEQLGREYRLTRERVRQVVSEMSLQLRRTWGPRIPALLEKLRERCERNAHPLSAGLLERWLGEADLGLRLGAAGHVRLIQAIDRSFPCWPNEHVGVENPEAAAIFGAAAWSLLVGQPSLGLRDLLHSMRTTKGYPYLEFSEFIRLLAQIPDIVVDLEQLDRPVARLRRPVGLASIRVPGFSRAVSRRLVPFSLPVAASAA